MVAVNAEREGYLTQNLIELFDLPLSASCEAIYDYARTFRQLVIDQAQRDFAAEEAEMAKKKMLKNLHKVMCTVCYYSTTIVAGEDMYMYCPYHPKYKMELIK